MSDYLARIRLMFRQHRARRKKASASPFPSRVWLLAQQRLLVMQKGVFGVGMNNLAGMHDRESVALGITDTWALDTIALSDNPASRHYEAGYEWICRANWGYGSTGTLPKPDWYGEYVVRLSNYVRGSDNCHRWVIGNEPNLSREWPDNQPIYPWDYANCYKAARRHIHAILGHEQDEVLIAASGPWNDELKYEGNSKGDWIVHFEDVIKACGSEIDGFSIHSYTHGYNVALVTSSARMQAPFQNRHYEFRTYRDYMAAIPVGLWSLPVYLTEANGNGPWQAVGLMPAMVDEIDHWNKNGNHPIRAVIFYRYPKYDDFYIEGRADVIAEYRQAIGRGYKSPPVMGAQTVMKQTFIPNVSSGPSVPTQPQPELPLPEWDERLTARGVSVETPPLRPGQSYWRVAKARWYDEQEADRLGPDHHIMADALDAKGARVPGVNMEVKWPTDQHVIVTEAKPGEPYSANYPMSPSRNEYSIKVGPSGEASETLKGIGMGAETPSGFNAGIHTSTGVVFQLATMPQASKPQPPTTEPTPQPATVPPLAHPIADPTQRVVSQSFGDNPQDYARFGMAGHNGVDYAVPIGTPIVAVDDGQVIEFGNDEDGYGIYLKLRHTWGESIYAHLERKFMQMIDAPVHRGMGIGLSGNTGNSTGPHLHLGIRVNPYRRGAPYDGYSDPQPYLEGEDESKPITRHDMVKAIALAAMEFDVDSDLLLSQAWAESSFNPNAVSGAGAKGLMQIMPATWAEWSAKIGAGNDPFDPKQNARIGAAYMKWLMQQTKGNAYDALVAYGWGIGNWLGDEPVPPMWAGYASKIVHGRDLLKAIGA